MNLRYFWRSVALVLVALFALSPTLCYASETATTDSAIDYPVMDMTITDSEILGGYLESAVSISAFNQDVVSSLIASSYNTFTPPSTLTFSSTNNTNAYNFWNASKEYYRISVFFRQGSGTSIVDEGEYFDLSIGNFRLDAQHTYMATTGYNETWKKSFDTSKLNLAQAILWNGVPSSSTDYSIVDFTNDLNISGNTFGANLKEVEAPFDVKYIELDFYFLPDAIHFNDKPSNFSYFHKVMNWNFCFVDTTFSLELTDQSVGLLKGVIEFLKTIINSIKELPSKIWSAMEEGIKGLFVPSEADMVAYKDKWDTLLAERFGVVYQSGTIITDTLGSITEQSAQGTINLPATTIHFADTDFTFGGYDVPVVPQGFEWLVEIIKGLIDIVITVAFINAMRTKYDQLMRG